MYFKPILVRIDFKIALISYYEIDFKLNSTLVKSTYEVRFAYTYKE